MLLGTLLMILLLPGITSLLIPIPLEQPHSINSHELICHYGLPVSESTYGTKYSVKILTPSQTSHEVEGYLCSKTMWETKCEKGFFGGTTKTYIIHKSPVSDNECLDSYKRMKEGDEIMSPHFPPDYCSWMSTNSKSETYLTLTKHNVHKDPYKNSFVDLVFLGHRCNHRICSTHYENVKWITDSSEKGSCTEWYTVEGFITLDNSKNLEWSYVEAEFIPKTPLSQLCFGLTYCGVRGYVLNNGLFFSPLIGPNSEVNFNRDVPVNTCSGDKEVSIHPLSSSMASVELQTLEILFNTKCNDIVNNIKGGKNITTYELGFLNPTHPGIGYGFININGRLFSAKSRFEPVKNYIITHSDPPTIKYLDYRGINKTIKIDNCTWYNLVNESIVCRWYNGIIITQDKIISPYSTKEELKLEVDLYDEIIPNFDHHIGIPDLNNDTIHTLDQVTDPDYENADIVGSIEEWFVQWFHYLGLIVTIIFIGLVIYCCSCCVKKCVSCYSCMTCKKSQCEPKVKYDKNIESVQIIKGVNTYPNFKF